MTICVVGFPLGAATTRAKAAETREAIANGADEIDMVVNLGLLKSGDHNAVFDDIRGVVEAAAGRPVKVILETHLLTREQKIATCALSKAAGAAFVKTSTGFSGGGATVEDIRLMRQVVGPDMGVKASGGVRNTADAHAMIGAGATDRRQRFGGHRHRRNEQGRVLMPIVALVVADSLGVGEMPDADRYGDAGSDTLGHIAAFRPSTSPTSRRSASPASGRSWAWASPRA